MSEFAINGTFLPGIADELEANAAFKTRAISCLLIFEVFSAFLILNS
jgi:hypothetical protein